MVRFERFVNRLCGGLNWIAIGSIAVMMLLTCVDVIGRSFRMPVPGAYELTGFLGLIAIAFAIANNQINKAHISIQFAVSHLPRKVQGFVGTVVYAVSMALFVVLIWQSITYANDMWSANELTLTLNMPFYPFIYLIAIVSAPVVLVLFIDFTESLRKVFRK